MMMKKKNATWRTVAPRSSSWIPAALVVVVGVVHGLMPPHPDRLPERYETVRERHRRLNITYDYKPRNFPLEHCHYWDEAKCRLEDEGYGRARAKHLQKQRRRKRQLRRSRRRELNPNSGAVRALVLLIRFPEDQDNGNKPVQYDQTEHLEQVFNGDTERRRRRRGRRDRDRDRRLRQEHPPSLPRAPPRPHPDRDGGGGGFDDDDDDPRLVRNLRYYVRPTRRRIARGAGGAATGGRPTNRTAAAAAANSGGDRRRRLQQDGGGGSVREWMRYASLGSYDVAFDFVDWDTAPQTASYYAGGVSGRRGSLEMQQVIDWKLEKLDQEGFDFAPYDSDNDGELDLVVGLHTGYPAEIGVRCDKNPEDRIWSQATAHAPTGGWRGSKSGMILSAYVLSSVIGTFGECSTPEPLFEMAITTHEIMHTFFLVDVYDTDLDEPRIGVGGVGNYDIMANAYGWQRNPSLPGHLSPWSRVVAGWLEPIEITKNGIYAVQPSEISGTVYVIRAGYPRGEYLLIENRGGLKWDKDWPNQGILIYHVDEAADYMNYRGYPGHPNWPDDHYIVALQQADGRYDLEQGNGLGDEGDFWKKGMTLGPSEDDSVWPNTNSYQRGSKPTGISVTVLSDPGFIMQILVEGIPNGATGFAPELVPVDPSDQNRYYSNRHHAFSDTGPVAGITMPSGDQANETGKTLTWVLSLLSGVAVMFGVMTAIFVL